MNKKFKHIKRLAYFYTLLTLIILGVFIVGSYYFPILDELIHDELFVTSFLCVFVLLNGFLCLIFYSLSNLYLEISVPNERFRLSSKL